MNNMNNKECSKCKKYVDKSFFSKDPTKRDGLYSSCKFCNNKKKLWEYNRFEDGKKICTKCLKYLPLDSFVKDNRIKDRYTSNCKVCKKEGVDIILEKETSKKYYENNKEEIIKRNLLYNKSERGISLRRERDKNRRKDPVIKIQETISRQINKVLQGEKNGEKWKNLVGYNEINLKVHLEDLFEDWMNWDNYGKLANYKEKTWHLDHIKPISSFNFNDKDNIKKCWALENLRPLDKIENIKKGNKYNE